MKKLVKRILAAAVTASMAISALPVFAADSDSDYINIENTSGAGGGGANAIGWSGGPTGANVDRKIHSDEAFGSRPKETFAELSTTISTDKFIYLYNATDFTWSDANKKRVFYVEADFVPLSGVNKVYLKQRYNNLTKPVDISKAKKDDWNHIKFEIDFSSGRVSTELNGEKVRVDNLAMNVSWDLMNQVRIQYEGDGTD